jgi:aspartyl protease family protein
VPRLAPSAIASLLLVCALRAAAGEVQVVAITPGTSADLVIGGAASVTVQIGETVDGVTLVSTDRRGAVVQIRGVTKTLPLSAYRGSVGEPAVTTITLSLDPRGHFFTSAIVNGTPVQFMVDTGATDTAISSAVAKSAGIDYQRGQPIAITTANGVARGWRVSLNTLRVGGSTEYDVPAVVQENDTIGVGLLGMSYLNRFDMQRRGPTLVLHRR